MSCYQVSGDLIDLIVAELFRYRYRGGGQTYLYLPSGATIHTDAMRDLAEPAYGADYLVVRVTAYDQADAVGRELVAANVASVEHRYPGDEMMIGYRPGDYSFRRVPDDRFATAGHVLGACRGYWYQTCERGDERSSLWGEIITAVERLAVERLAGDAFGEGWSWSREWQVDQMRAARASIATI